MSPRRDVIVIGASAGGIEALVELVRELPAGLPAALFVVLHFPANSTSTLPRILSRTGRLPARHAQDGMKVEPGTIYVAPPNQHLLLRDGFMHLTYGPREHGFRPAVDPLFRSAGRAYGPRVVGVILSGMLGDGSAGLREIKRAGGVAIVQDPQEAIFPQMPVNAIEKAPVDEILSLEEIAGEIQRLATIEEAEMDEGQMPKKDQEIEAVNADIAAFERGEQPQDNALLTCPDCGGVMWELRDSQVLRYRCHVGHAYNDESMLFRQAEALEAALWAAVRALEERAMLVRRLAAKAGQRGSAHIEERFREQADEVEQNANLIRRLILNGRTLEPRFTPPAGADPPDPAVFENPGPPGEP